MFEVMHKVSTSAVEKYLRKYFIDHIPVDNLWITQWWRMSGKANELLKSALDGYDRWAFRPEHWSEGLGLLMEEDDKPSQVRIQANALEATMDKQNFQRGLLLEA